MHPSPSIAPLQRRVILVRHAKAVEEEPSGGDHARALSERGRGDAVALGQWLGAQGLSAAQVYCSTAARTRETLAALTNTAVPDFSDRLYLASATELLAQLQQSDDRSATVMLVGHNPGMHGLLALLTGDYADEADADRMLLKFPTSACAVLSAPLDRWRDLSLQSMRLETLRA